MPTPDELAAQLTDWLDKGRVLAGQVAALDATPADPGTDPQPQPEPEPPAAAPAKPTGLTCTLGADARPALRWDPATGATAWEVHDLANPTKTLQATVTEPRSTRSALKPGQRRRYAVLAVGPGGRSAMSDPIDVPPASEDEPAPQPQPDPGGEVRYPADIFGRDWYLTLPTAVSATPDTVKQPKLATYSSKYCELTPARDGVIFRAWHGGITTANSPNPRSELREMVNGGVDKAAWSPAKGRHSMTVEGQVNRLTKVRPHCVIAQIHGGSDDVTVWRVEDTKLWITDGDNTHGHLVTDQFQLGQRYTLRFDAADGKITFAYNGDPVPYTVNSTSTTCYFKVGAYLQSNPKSAPDESTDEYAEVCVYRVDVTHTA